MGIHSRMVQSISSACIGALLYASASVAIAQSDVYVYVCVGPDGQKTYTNSATSRSCKRLDMYPILSVPAPRRGASSASASTAQPANFPKVDRDTQRARDSDRRQILDEELKSEQEKLARLQAEYKSGEPDRKGDERNYARYQERTAKMQEDIQRAQANISSLNRELALLRQ